MKALRKPYFQMFDSVFYTLCQTSSVNASKIKLFELFLSNLFHSFQQIDFTFGANFQSVILVKQFVTRS